ncbi:MAG: hypothetical protein ACRC3Y_12305 [Romboutsia sp.]|uniref:hypothetical protein n=1 Tax=Romboutsia sp. TaxID=1965302 RepID=UPI003F3EDCEC
MSIVITNNHKYLVNLLFYKWPKITGISSSPVIGNTTGGLIGIVIFCLFIKVFKNRTITILNILASIATVVLVSFLLILLLVN